MDYNITTMALSAHHNPNNYVFNGKMMLSSVIILFVLVLILLCFHNHSRWFSYHRHSRRPRRAHHRFLFSSSFNTTTNTNNNRGTVPHEALDISILKTIPAFVYFSTIHKQRLECAVCLSEFEDNEKVRVLPQCKHSFHVDCIDLWFRCHSNCPLCRAAVEPDTSIPVEEAVSVTEPARLTIAREEDDGGVGCSSSTSPPLELVSVIVELPRVECRGLDDMGLAPHDESGFKSPGNRVLTLKRNWSI